MNAALSRTTVLFFGAVVLFFAASLNLFASSHRDDTRPTVIVVVGAAGEEEYGKEFREAAMQWQKSANGANANCVTIGLGQKPDTNDVRRLQAALADESTNSAAALWLVFIGHGTWDGKSAKFNAHGPDLTAEDLASALRPFSRPVAILNTASASGPWIKSLSHSNRVVISATRSGAEQNYARFGKYLAESIAAPAADLDKDGQTSLLEAFLMASRKVNEFYNTEGRLATEHALLDDNGDGLGTPADWFRGVRAVKTPAAGGAIDGVRAHQWHLVLSAQDEALSPAERQRRAELEIAIEHLRQRKSQLPEAEYYRELEKLMTQLSPLISR